MTDKEWLEIWNDLRALWPARQGENDNAKIRGFYRRLRFEDADRVKRAAEGWVNSGKTFPAVSDLRSQIATMSANEGVFKPSIPEEMCEALAKKTSEMHERGWTEVVGSLVFGRDGTVRGYRQRFVHKDRPGSTTVQTLMPDTKMSTELPFD